jgi:hypothetical protein
MSPTDPTDADLRAAFAAREPDDADPALDEETLDAIWAAAAGAADAETRAALLARARAEPAVAEAWRMAHAVNSELRGAPALEAEDTGAPRAEDAEPPKVVQGPASWWRHPAVVVGGLAAAAAAALFLQIRTGPPDVDPMRADTPAISTPLDATTPLPRDAATLRWSGAAEGSTYRVTLTTAELAPVASVGGLLAPTWTVPPASLEPLPAGTRLLWRVEARDPEGSRQRSPTFEAVLQ